MNYYACNVNVYLIRRNNVLGVCMLKIKIHSIASISRRQVVNRMCYIWMKYDAYWIKNNY